VTADALLEQLGLPEYRHALRHAGVVDVDSLKALTDSRLKILGITDAGHRERILGAVSALPSEQAAEPPQAPEPGLAPTGTADADAPTAIFVKAELEDAGSAALTDPAAVDETPVPGGTEPESADLDSAGFDDGPGDTQAFVYGQPPGTTEPTAPQPPHDDEDEDDSDDVSLDQFDGQVTLGLEADDDTDLPQSDLLGDVLESHDELDRAGGSSLGKILGFLAVLVLMAGVGGFFVVQSALKSDEAVSVPPTAHPIPSPPPAPAAPSVPAAQAEPEPVPEPPPAPASTEPIRPSFPCTRAESRVELLICGSAELARLDRQLARSYGDARRRMDQDAFAEVRAAQKRWLRSRDACTDDACVAKRMGERLAELE